MKEENRKKLILKYLTNKASEKEILVFFEEMKEDTFVALLEELEISRVNAAPKQPWFRFAYWAAAASILLAIGTVIYFWAGSYLSEHTKDSIAALEQYRPAENKAIMTIDGERVAVLSDSAEYVDRLSFFEKEKEIQYVTVETQVANVFRMALPDGSIVYLNAESKLKFPKKFSSASDRQVELEGEAYFEVKSDINHPFIVATSVKREEQLRQMDVRVTGTKFLVSNYRDQSDAHTVLLEGKVAVNTAKIDPGYIYQMDKEGQQVYKLSSLRKYVDWVEGTFEFEGEQITDILRKIEKWYGVKFIGKKATNKYSFGGVISRSVPLKDILNLLEENTDLRFEQATGNQITILLK
ncbi:FecR family protein [Sphingobacterium faecale]|uniref:FecR family protein n=1 Tax=Sphingobacterium faecale TaxID=2803775 RepID=A0ABS1R6J8_9SPHI|nr:FecR family protein [Sphingobacterium faecale]MBL1409496.1 FecR family protein [Sphingobacterium faecale]